jgi:hypothetical protein
MIARLYGSLRPGTSSQYSWYLKPQLHVFEVVISSEESSVESGSQIDLRDRRRYERTVQPTILD